MEGAPAAAAPTTLTLGAIASSGAAIMHATAAGMHADHAALSRVFLVLAVAQAAVAVVAFLRRDRVACISLFVVNAGAAAGWLITRFVGIDQIDGLQVAESPTPADTIAAALAMVAVATAVTCALGRSTTVPSTGIAMSAIIVGVALVPGLADTTSHDHDDHTDTEHATDHDDGHDHDDGAETNTADGAATADDHDEDHDDGHDHDAESSSVTTSDDASDDDHADHGDHAETTAAAVDPATVWPRPWDPTGPIDFAGVPGVTDEQLARAEQLVVDTLRDLPAFADVDSVGALGYRSIGDASTGYEHYINTALITDDKFLDPTAPESLVYRVDGADRTLVSAMFIAAQTPIDDPTLTDFAGPLMQWHVHDNLCWGLDDAGNPVVRSVLEQPGDACPAGTVNAGGDNPMVHVWIAPHECGPFAALEGHGAGQASVSDGARMDQCDHGAHGDHDDHGDTAAAATKPYDPELPIDLGGVEGVTLQQQAFAENLVAATLRDLPQWADPAVAEAAGFRSIGDAGTGHEHYIQWDWIDDDVWLDPDRPESLVFQPTADGGKQLVSAMFMLPSDVDLDDVPDWGGELMQWHIHGDLCFTDDPEAPQVAGVKPLGSSCRAPLVDGPVAPMIHVWIVPHECGPFAALDGIAGGQVPDGETVLCDHAHGSH